jgi:hypothetical protein
MRTYKVTIHKSFDNDSIEEVKFNNQTFEQVLTLFEKLDGKSISELQIFISNDSYPYLYVIGGPEMFTFSLAENEISWKEPSLNPDPDTSKWRTFGLGYSNYEFYEDELCNKIVVNRAIKHFCESGKWLTDIPYKSASPFR